MSLAEIIAEGKRLVGKDDAAFLAFFIEHGPRLLAVAEAAVEMRRCSDDTRSMSCGEWDAAVAAFDRASRGDE